MRHPCLKQGLFLLLFLFAGSMQSLGISRTPADALLTIQNLSPADRARLEKLWSEARRGYEARLTGQ